MKKKDPISLWQEDGDLSLMNIFFQGVGASLEEKERIKQLALVKLAEEPLGSKTAERGAMTEKRFAGLIFWVLGIAGFFKSLWWRWRWKLALPVALVALVGIGLGIMPNILSRGMSMNQPQMSAAIRVAPDTRGITFRSAGAGSAAPGGGVTGNGAYNDKVQPQAKAATSSSDGAHSNTQQSVANSNSLGPQNNLVTASPPVTDGHVERKLVQNLDVTLQVAQVDKAVEQITGQVSQLGGYIVDAQQNSSDSNSSGRLLVKIPTGRLDEFRGKIPALGKVLNQHLTSNDITDQYYDTQTRLRSWEAEEERYLVILKQAKTVDEVLK
ncbi:MAG: DUF4349 domain-containing protein, partial [Desulfitobacteriaceae bacterium]